MGKDSQSGTPVVLRRSRHQPEEVPGQLCRLYRSGRAPDGAEMAPGRWRQRSEDPHHLRPPRPEQEAPDWPNKGFDFGPSWSGSTRAIQPLQGLHVRSRHGDRRRAGQENPGRRQGRRGRRLLVYQMNCWNRVAQTMAASGKPVLYADFQYAGSGGSWSTRRVSWAKDVQRRLRRLVADGRPGRRGQVLRRSKRGRRVVRFRRRNSHGARRPDAPAGEPLLPARRGHDSSVERQCAG